MAIVQCAQGHYYDNTESALCPYCKMLQDRPEDRESRQEQKTVYQAEAEQESKTQAYGSEVQQEDRTVSLYMQEQESRRTVGWLVCVSGVQRGQSFPLFDGKNLAGSREDMEIVLPEQPDVSPETHFLIAFDARFCQFYLVGGAGTTYLNGEHCVSPHRLKEDDRIRAGDGEYIFVPYCREGRTWE